MLFEMFTIIQISFHLISVIVQDIHYLSPLLPMKKPELPNLYILLSDGIYHITKESFLADLKTK